METIKCGAKALDASTLPRFVVDFLWLIHLYTLLIPDPRPMELDLFLQQAGPAGVVLSAETLGVSDYETYEITCPELLSTALHGWKHHTAGTLAGTEQTIDRNGALRNS